MSTGDDNNFFNPSKIGGNVADVFLQTITAGLLGYKGEGLNFQGGVTTNAAVEGVKEITGAKAAEEANAMAVKQFEQQKVDAEKARTEAQQQNFRDQVVQSRLAGRAQSVPGQKIAANPGSNLGDDEQNFLGL